MDRRSGKKMGRADDKATRKEKGRKKLGEKKRKR